MTNQIRKLKAEYIKEIVVRCLDEDIIDGRATNDRTAHLLKEDAVLDARLLVREPAIICGIEFFNQAFSLLTEEVEIEWLCQEGHSAEADETLCYIRGNARALLTAERTALNILQTLSGTATTTNEYVKAVEGTGCRVLDTRKTLPGLRLAQKYAVTIGGGWNHRIGLSDGILIKENHISAAGSVENAVKQALEEGSDLQLVEVEVETFAQLNEALFAGATRIMLDNFDLEQTREAVKHVNRRAELEASGNMTLETIREVAETGVDFISIGALTKHLRAIDFSMRPRDD